MKDEHKRAIEAVKKLQRSFFNNVKITGDLAHVVFGDEEALIERYLSTMRESGYELVKLDREAMVEAIMPELPSSPMTAAGMFNPDDPTGFKWATSVAGHIAQAIITTLTGGEDE